MENNQSVFEKFEVVKSEPYRFIGSSVYIGNKAPGEWPSNNRMLFDIHDSIWELKNWVFTELDKLKEYASDETHNAVLVTWEKYDDKNQLYGYYIGKFMKADTPVPNGMDYFDVNEDYFAKAWKKGKFGDRFGNHLVYGEGECKQEIEKPVYMTPEDGCAWRKCIPNRTKTVKPLSEFIFLALKNKIRRNAKCLKTTK